MSIYKFRKNLASQQVNGADERIHQPPRIPFLPTYFPLGSRDLRARGGIETDRDRERERERGRAAPRRQTGEERPRVRVNGPAPKLQKQRRSTVMAFRSFCLIFGNYAARKASNLVARPRGLPPRNFSR